MVSYQNATGMLQAQAEDRAEFISDIISQNPDVWEYQQIKFEGYLAKDPWSGVHQARRIFNNHNKVIVDNGAEILWPSITRSAELFDSGKPAGRLEITQSMRPILSTTERIALFSITLSIALFIMVRIVPIAAISRAETALRKSKEDLEKRVEERTMELSKLLKAISIANEGIAITDEEDRFIYANDAHSRIYGYPQNELREKTWRNLITPELVPLVEDDFHKTVRKKDVGTWSGESPALRKDGTIIPTEVTATSRWDEKGNYLGHICIVRDITERKRQEQALADSEANYRRLFDSATDGIFILSLDGNFIDANRNAYERLGYTREEFLALSISKLDHPSFAPKVPERFNQIWERGFAVFESAHLRKNGSMMPVEVNARLLEYRGKQVFFSVIRDITERKKVEEALRESEKRYHALFDQSPDGIVLVNAEGKIIEFNESAHRELGYTREEFSGLSVSDINPFEGPDDVKARIQKINQLGQADFFVQHRTKQGELRDVHVISHIIMLSGIPVTHALWHDITEIKSIRDRLEEKSAEQNTILENALVGIAFLKDRRFVWINSRMEQMFGMRRDEVSGITTEKFFPSRESYEEFGKDAYKSLVSGVTYSTDQLMKRKDGSFLWCSLSGKAIDAAALDKGAIWILQDITEKKRVEEQIRSSLTEKEVLLKEVHHRVKNNLQIISSILQLQAGYVRDEELRMLFDDSKRRVEAMSLIHEKLYRSGDLSRIDFKEYVSDLAENLALLNAGWPNQIEVKIDVEGIMLDVNNAIPCGLIINELVSNAFKHAFPNREKGKVTIRMRRMNEKRIFLGISDDGTGFPESVDFRNTASLGLQLVNALVLQLGGVIELDRSKGTTFKIEFDVQKSLKRAL